MQSFIFGGLYMNKIYRADYESPIGTIEIAGNDQAVVSILFTDREKAEYPLEIGHPDAIKECWQQLDEYFKGERREFSFPYMMEGTNFQQRVWNALTSIPYASTGTYKDIASLIENEKAVRAVGTANGRNKLSIVLPCHRIIGTNGTMTGYAGGIWRKEWLLEHERKHFSMKS